MVSSEASSPAGEFPSEVFVTWPSVYAVGGGYQILVGARVSVLMWCEIAGRCHYDDFNGVLRSETPVHRMTVPRAELDAAGGYTICYRVVGDRRSYFSETGPVRKCSFEFQAPPTGRPVRLFMLADNHGRLDAAVDAARDPEYPLDLLVLNGDYADGFNAPSDFDVVALLAGRIARGRIPVVFSRGNHDLRGKLAERLGEHAPTDDGRTFYTFRLGHVWGMVLDAGEDKDETHRAYGGTNACHAFRLRETRFIRQVAERAEQEYAAPGVRHRLVVCHLPFPERGKGEFDIEADIYREWCGLLARHVRPQLILSGHVHALYVTMPGDPKDDFGQPCPVVVGSLPGQDPRRFTGTRIELQPTQAIVQFVDQDHRVWQTIGLPLAN